MRHTEPAHIIIGISKASGMKTTHHTNIFTGTVDLNSILCSGSVKNSDTVTSDDGHGKVALYVQLFQNNINIVSFRAGYLYFAAQLTISSRSPHSRSCEIH